MYSRMYNFLEQQKIFIKNLFGFRKYHSSYMALMIMLYFLINFVTTVSAIMPLIGLGATYRIDVSLLPIMVLRSVQTQSHAGFPRVLYWDLSCFCCILMICIMFPPPRYRYCMQMIQIYFTRGKILIHWYVASTLNLVIYQLDSKLINCHYILKKHYMLFSKHRSKHMDGKITSDGHEIDQVVKTRLQELLLITIEIGKNM